MDTLSRSSASPDTSPEIWKTTRDRGNWIPGNKYNIYDLVTHTWSIEVDTTIIDTTVTFVCLYNITKGKGLDLVRVVPNPYDIRSRMFQFGDKFQYDRIAFYGLPPACKLKIFTERGDLIWERDHKAGTGGDELWDSQTSSGQIVASGIYILYVEAPGQGSVFRKFVIIR
jgi:hypothetical protein